MATPGRIAIRFDSIYKKSPFADEAVRRQMLATINEIPGVRFDEDVLAKMARMPFDKLTMPDDFKTLK